jgi:hypothetical protein
LIFEWKRKRGEGRVIGYWLLVIGYWLLVIGYWLLVIGYWLLVIREEGQEATGGTDGEIEDPAFGYTCQF